MLRDIDATRKLCADLIGADKSEVALLGPTSLGLSLFANGITWREGDEVVCYYDDYPSNVYPWMALASQGVKIRQLRPERPGHITPELVERELSSRTRLVALASCHYLSGWRIDVDAIGESLHKRGVLFSVDAIQTLGAFPFSVRFVDFLSADAHKWMLGPMAIGIVYVARQHFELCRPTLLGSWNIHSPQFLAQETIKFHETAQRYEPGVLNVAGAYGMKASLEMIEATGLGINISSDPRCAGPPASTSRAHGIRVSVSVARRASALGNCRRPAPSDCSQRAFLHAREGENHSVAAHGTRMRRMVEIQPALLQHQGGDGAHRGCFARRPSDLRVAYRSKTPLLNRYRGVSAGFVVRVAGQAVLSISSRMRFSPSSLASGRSFDSANFLRAFSSSTRKACSRS